MVEVNFERLRASRASGRLAHALCFSGPVESDFIWKFAQLLVCEGEAPPCGLCAPCKRVINHQSESVLWISRKRTPSRSRPRAKFSIFCLSAACPVPAWW